MAPAPYGPLDPHGDPPPGIPTRFPEPFMPLSRPISCGAVFLWRSSAVSLAVASMGLGLLILTGCAEPTPRSADAHTGLSPSDLPPTDLRFQVTFPAELAAGPLDGRLVLLISHQEEGEPRFQLSDGDGTAQGFGIDVEGWEPGEPAVIDGSVFGYPISGLGGVPAGAYRVQAVLNRYHTYHRADGHVVKLPPDRGEGQVWNRKPGNLYSEPMEFRVDPARSETLYLALAHEIPPVAPFEEQETGYLRYFRMRSDLLSDFWGEDVFLAAWVLLPEGFAERPDAHYPLAIWHGHFPSSFSGWRETPPNPELECTYSARFRLDCYNRIEEEEAWRLFQLWTGPDFLRHLVIQIQHPTPYYDDSYAVNSENNGPYGDALTYELIPAIEREFQGIGEGWGRFLYGGSTGGWEAMAAQVLYPDEYNGAWASCPDPIDFRAYTVVNLYEDENAYHYPSRFKRTPRPGRRDHLGRMAVTLEEMNHREAVLGSRGRSGDQWDIWQATYSPVGPDGYPMPIWDKITGAIDPEVAAHWRENYDLVHILQRDWASGLGERLRGKLAIYVGDLDNYYLDNAVYLAEEFLEGTTNPPYGGEVLYGDRAEHCWNGDPDLPNHLSRLRYIEMHAPKIEARLRSSAPEGVEWRRQP
jgi:hypothetical protein